MADTWESLRAECMRCQGCGLAGGRTHVVFGDGSQTARVLFVGEGPGQNEDEQGVPFVGKAGQLLDDMLAMIGLDRTQVYIANIVKCRPPQNRDPLNTEREACFPFLRRQMALLQPKLLVCLGRIAATELIKPDFKITREHGQWFERDGMLLMAMYHPAALLRDPTKKPDTFEDLKSLQQKIREVCPETVLRRDW
ncbi:MAG: uracil-DNA glycosylase [Oscillospiraceae bacterium]|nr:uracil-DNA glycosylase [Oscillospiraceae bacterium]